MTVGLPEDETGNDLVHRLLLLGNQLMSMARDLSTGHEAASAEAEAIGEALALDSDLWLELARQIYSERRRRARFLPDDLFGEPAWDLLLDLYISAKQNQEISTTSACIAADVPSTTALRWLNILEDRGLIERRPDPDDQRRTIVRLSRRGYAHMTEYFANSPTFMVRDDALRRKVRGEAPSRSFGPPARLPSRALG